MPWLPKDLADQFADEGYEAQASQIIKGVTDRVKQATEPVQQAAESAGQGVSSLMQGLTASWTDEPSTSDSGLTAPWEDPNRPRAASGTPAAMPTNPPSRATQDNVVIQDGRQVSGGGVAPGSRAARYAPEIAQVSAEEGVPQDVLAAIIDTENSDENSTSKDGARGLTQVVPGQGFDLPGEDASDPLTSIRQSARALKEKNRMVGGDWDETGAAYFGYGTDSLGNTTSAYRDQYIANRRLHQAAVGPFEPIPLAPYAPPLTRDDPRADRDLPTGTEGPLTRNDPRRQDMGDLTPEQAALDDPDKWALCGPVAAVAMAKAKGQDWTVAQAKALAQSRNLWDASLGMHGLQSEADLLNAMDIPAKTGAADWQQIAADVRGGNPVTLSTSWTPGGHYVVLEKMDDQGRFYVGGAGNTLKVTTGRSKWMTVDEMQALGVVNGALYFDNPNTPTPSVAASTGAQAATPASQGTWSPDRPAGASAASQTPTGRAGGGGVQQLVDRLASTWTDQPIEDPDLGPHEATPGSVGAGPVGPVYGPENVNGVDPEQPGTLRPSDLPPDAQGARPWLTPSQQQAAGVNAPPGLVDSLVPRSAEVPIVPATAENPPQPDRFDQGGAQPGRQHTPTPIERDTADAFANDTPGPNAAERAISGAGRGRFLNEPPGQQAQDIAAEMAAAPQQAYTRARQELVSDSEARHQSGTDPVAPFRDLGTALLGRDPFPSKETLNPSGAAASDVAGGALVASLLPIEAIDPVGTVGFMAAGGVLRRLPGANRWLLGRLTSFVERQQKLDGFQVVEDGALRQATRADLRAAYEGAASGRGAPPRPGLVRVGDLADAADSEARNATEVIHGLVDSGQISVEDGQRLAASAARSYLDTANRDAVRLSRDTSLPASARGIAREQALQARQRGAAWEARLRDMGEPGLHAPREGVSEPIDVGSQGPDITPGPAGGETPRGPGPLEPVPSTRRAPTASAGQQFATSMDQAFTEVRKAARTAGKTAARAGRGLAKEGARQLMDRTPKLQAIGDETGGTPLPGMPERTREQPKPPDRYEALDAVRVLRGRADQQGDQTLDEGALADQSMDLAHRMGVLEQVYPLAQAARDAKTPMERRATREKLLDALDTHASNLSDATEDTETDRALRRVRDRSFGDTSDQPSYRVSKGRGSSYDVLRQDPDGSEYSVGTYAREDVAQREWHRLTTDQEAQAPGQAEPSSSATTNEVAKEEAPTKHEYSSTQLDLPKKLADTVRRYSKNAIADEDLHEKGRETTPHVTVKYGLTTENADDVRRIVEAHGPITLTLGKTGVFEKAGGGKFDVVQVGVDSPQLHALNSELSKLPNGDEHPTYQPHMTLAYVKPGRGRKYKGSKKLDGQQVTINELTFSSKNGERTTIPLAGKSETRDLPKSADTIPAETKSPPGQAETGRPGSLYHETDPRQAVSIATGLMDKRGLNVARDPSFALGQGGQGAVVELSDKGVDLRRGRRKPGAAMMEAAGQGAPEYEIVSAPHDGSEIARSITFAPGFKRGSLPAQRLRSLRWHEERLDDGRVRYTNPRLDSTTEANPKQAERAAEPSTGGEPEGRSVEGMPRRNMAQERAAGQTDFTAANAPDSVDRSATLPDEEASDAGQRDPAAERGGPDRPDRAPLAGERPAAVRPAAEGGDAAPGRAGDGRSDRSTGAEPPAQRVGTARGVGPGDERGRAEPVAPTLASPSPASAGRDYVMSDRDLAEKSPARRFDHNLDALDLLAELGSHHATPEQQAVLARYSGFGDSEFNPAFPAYGKPQDGVWARRRERLETALGRILGDEEQGKTALRSIERSRRNAMYTTPEVVRSMWDAARRLGIESLNRPRILEPSAGSGRFLGLMPPELAARSARSAVELDTVTGKLLEKLFPNADVQITGFQDAVLPNESFDLVISNVPFADTRVVDRTIKKDILKGSVHNYFFAKALQKVRPGGVIAFVTTHYTLDAKSAKPVRTYLAQQAELLGAIRLPQDAFPDTAVTTDVIFLRKYGPDEEAPATPPAWTETVDKEEVTTPYASSPEYKVKSPYTISRYFDEHPEMALGRHTTQGGRGQYGASEYRLVKDDRDIPAELGKAVKKLPQDVITPAPTEDTSPRLDLARAPTGTKEGAYIVDNGRLVVNRGGRPELVSLGKEDRARVFAMLGLRDAAKDVLNLQLENATNPRVQAAQRKLGKLYDDFVSTHGPLNAVSNRKLMAEDPDGPFLRALERVAMPVPPTHQRPIKDQAVIDRLKMPIFRERVVRPATPVEKADRAEDAVAIVLNENGRLIWDRVAKLLGRDVEDVQRELASKGLIYRNPEADAWETADQYLSGNVREKLRVAEAAAGRDDAYKPNVEALKAVQPRTLEPSEIEVRMGTHWIEAADREAGIRTSSHDDFFRHLLGASPSGYKGHGEPMLRYIPQTSEWMLAQKVDLDRAKESAYATSRVDADRIFLASLNGKQITVWDEDAQGNKSKNAQASLQADQAGQRMRDEFKRWVWEDGERAGRLADYYNEHYNNLRPRQYDGSHLTLPGSNPSITLREHQKDAVWRIIQDGTALLAHEVGFGKTYTMIAAGMELRRLGLAKKNVYVVLDHMVEQFARDFRQLYPTAGLLVPEKGDFGKDRRPVLTSRIATGDWDGVILTKTQFAMLPVLPETEARFIQEQISDLEAAIAAEEQASEGKKSRTQKQLQKSRDNLRAKLEGIRDRMSVREDKTLAFEELGVDTLFADEADIYKNLFFATRMSRVKGLSNTNSQRALGMQMKSRHLLRRQGGRGVVFATGTPVSNSIAELWTMLRYLSPDTLSDLDIDRFDAWAGQFGEITTSAEQSVTGKYQLVNRFSKFVNVPELSKLFQQVADVRMSEDLPEMEAQKPRLVGSPDGDGKRIVTVSPASHELSAYIKEIARRKANLKNVDPTEDNDLKIASDARKASLDIRLIPEYKDLAPDPDGKVAKAIDNIHQVWRDTAADKGAQVVFLDLSTPKAHPDTEADEEKVVDDETGEERAAFQSVYAEIKRGLLDKGIPEGDVRFIHDAKTKEQRQSLYNAVNAGRVRVLLGSTEKLGAGTNVQERLAALHHLDAPWRPRDIEQREGRILRPGNMVYGPDVERLPDGSERVKDRGKGVRIFQYVTEGSYDGVMWQAIEAKARAIKSIMRRDVTTRFVEEADEFVVSLAQAKALASGDPDVLKLFEHKSELAKLEAQRSSFTNAQARARTAITRIPRQLRGLREDLAQRQTAQQERIAEGKAPSKLTARDIARIEAEIAQAEQELEGFKGQIGRPFEQGRRLKALEREVGRLEAKLQAETDEQKAAVPKANPEDLAILSGKAPPEPEPPTPARQPEPHLPTEAERAEVARQDAEIAQRPPHAGYLEDDGEMDTAEPSVEENPTNSPAEPPNTQPTTPAPEKPRTRKARIEQAVDGLKAALLEEEPPAPTPPPARSEAVAEPAPRPAPSTARQVAEPAPAPPSEPVAPATPVAAPATPESSSQHVPDESVRYDQIEASLPELEAMHEEITPEVIADHLPAGEENLAPAIHDRLVDEGKIPERTLIDSETGQVLTPEQAAEAPKPRRERKPATPPSRDIPVVDTSGNTPPPNKPPTVNHGAERPEDSGDPANAALGQQYAASMKRETKRMSPGMIEAIRRAYVRAMTDDKVDLNILVEQIEKEHGALPPELRVDLLSRMSPGMAAKVNIDEGLKPHLQGLSQSDLAWLDVYLTHMDNIDVAAAMGLKAEAETIESASPFRGRSYQKLQTERQRLRAFEPGGIAENAEKARVSAKRVQQLERQVRRDEVKHQQQVMRRAASRRGKVESERLFSEGLTVADSRRALSSMAQELDPKRLARVQKAAAGVWEFNRSLLQAKVENDVISPELYDELVRRYPHYVPTRIVDFLKDPASGGPAVGKTLSLNDTGLRRNTLEGTTRRRENPLAATYRNAIETERVVKQNQVALAMKLLVDADPGLQEEFREAPDGHTLRHGEGYVAGFERGVRFRYVTGEPMASALKVAAVSPVHGFFRGFMHFWKELITRSPLFAAYQMPMDASSYVLREHSRASGNPLALGTALGDLAAGYAIAFRGLMTGEYKGSAASYMKSGGGMTGFNLKDIDAAREKVYDLRRRHVLEITGPKDIGRLMKGGLLFDWSQAIGERIELAPRVASYRRAQRAKKSEVESVIAGRDVTLDFQRGGYFAKYLNGLLGFFNVGAQASASIPRMWKENPRGFALMSSMVLGTAILLEAAMAGGDDDEWDDIPQSIKDRGCSSRPAG
jgi:N12 class adenine-specific DNA methylase/2'-5' RNA ligase